MLKFHGCSKAACMFVKACANRQFIRGLQFPELSQFHSLGPNFPHKPSHCLRNSTLWISKHLPGLLLQTAPAPTLFQKMLSAEPTAPGRKVPGPPGLPVNFHWKLSSRHFCCLHQWEHHPLKKTCRADRLSPHLPSTKPSWGGNMA